MNVDVPSAKALGVGLPFVMELAPFPWNSCMTGCLKREELRLTACLTFKISFNMLSKQNLEQDWWQS